MQGWIIYKAKKLKQGDGSVGKVPTAQRQESECELLAPIKNPGVCSDICNPRTRLGDREIPGASGAWGVGGGEGLLTSR